MSKKTFFTIFCIFAAALFLIPAYCQQTDETTVTIDVPSREGLNVAVSRVPPAPAEWVPASSINFGELQFDTTNNIFFSPDYYAVDVGVDSNASTWTLTHTIDSIMGQETSNIGQTLNSNVNVTFVKQTSDTASIQLSKVTFGESNGFSRTKSQLSGGWLRVYYGVADGGSSDAANAEPITVDKAAGLYQGAVTFSLTTN